MAGRPRTFDRDAVLAVAMEQFWRDGYDETSVAQLTSLMGITPPSLYAAFGDKAGLFEDAAASYFGIVRAHMEHSLSLPTAREAIADMLHVSAMAYTDPATPAGCFMLSEPRMQPRRAELRNLLQVRVERAIHEGELDGTANARLVADFVIAVTSGMSASARDGASRADVEGIATLALAALE